MIIISRDMYPPAYRYTSHREEYEVLADICSKPAAIAETGVLPDLEAMIRAEALSSGKVAAAVVDIVSSEPVKADNPLLRAPNLMITPHMAWASAEARTRLVQIVADNCRSWLEGKGQNVL